MKLLLIGDQESAYLWDHYKPSLLSEYDLILSTGDLNAKYLSFLVIPAKAGIFIYISVYHKTEEKKSVR